VLFNIIKTVHQVNEKYFSHPHLHKLFDRYATYNGSSPYRAPGIFTMISHLEHTLGSYFPKGGMYALSNELLRLALKTGVTFHFNYPVDKIVVEKSKARGLISRGLHFPSDLVISNADVYKTYRELLPGQKAPEKTLKQPLSSSAMIFFIGMKKQFPKLETHNIFFSKNYHEEFSFLFDKKDIYYDPTIYVYISSKKHEADAPHGSENWYVMVNAPSDTELGWEEIVKSTRAVVLKKLNRMLDDYIEQYIEFEKIVDPRHIQTMTGAHEGALYGPASHSMFTSFNRHPNFSKRVKGLYFCGGTVHPGGGIPLCLLSGKIVADLITR
jgi:phytoene desaturase